MRILSADEIDRALDFPALIDALRDAFAARHHAPPRHHHGVAREGAATATHLLMSAWTQGAPGAGQFIGTKIVNVFPENGKLGLPAVLGVYVLQSGESGAPLAVMDGTRLTHWRTAAASALAASYVARKDASRLLMVGAGALSPFLARAHRAVRPITRVEIWNHRREGAERVAQALREEGIDARAVGDLEAAARAADVISCASLSTEPLVRGAWLKPGAHLDLDGAFNLQMREADDAAVARARVFIDTQAAKTEGGDVALAIKAGAVSAAHVEADLEALCGGGFDVRRKDGDVTLFKSVGAAVEDLAAAMLVWRRVTTHDLELSK